MFTPKKENVNEVTDVEQLIGKRPGRPKFDPQKEERQELEAKKKTLKLMNALKVSAPIIKGCAERSGQEVSLSNQDLAKKMLQISNTFSKNWFKHVNLDPEDKGNLWMKNVIERYANEYLSDLWVKKGVLDLNGLNELLHLMEVKDIDFSEDWRHEWFNLDVKNSIKISMIKLGIQIKKNQSFFHFFRNENEDFEFLMNLIGNKIGKIVQENVPPESSQEIRVSLFSVLMIEAADLFSIIWMKEAKKNIKWLKGLSEEDREAYKAGKKEIGIEKIIEEFDKNIEIIMMISNKFVKKG